MNTDAASKILPPEPHHVREAADIVRAGGLVAFPTETVYGLGADATNSLAVAQIFATKGRPAFNPLITHISGLRDAVRLAVVPAIAEKLADAFWPGPLTMILKRSADCPIAELVSAGLPSLALRVPDHPVARALLEQAEVPIAAPSANRSGHVSATRADHVAADLGSRITMILDGGPAVHGIESTVLDVSSGEAVLLRPGAITRSALEAVIGKKIPVGLQISERPASPGLLESHYAPRARLRLNATDVESGEALLAFGPNAPCCADTINLSLAGNPIEAAANLFASLRKLDASGAAVIAVMPIPDRGLGEAINDRLRRAAAPRA